jgi:putative tricarboxylic transport membrane protein
LNFSRAALLIGFVLGHAIEKNLYLSLKLHGNYFFMDPIPLSLIGITVAFLAYNLWPRKSDRIAIEKDEAL